MILRCNNDLLQWTLKKEINPHQNNIGLRSRKHEWRLQMVDTAYLIVILPWKRHALSSPDVDVLPLVKSNTWHNMWYTTSLNETKKEEIWQYWRQCVDESRIPKLLLTLACFTHLAATSIVSCELAVTLASYLACSPSRTLGFWSRCAGLCSPLSSVSSRNENGQGWTSSFCHYAACLTTTVLCLSCH